MFKVLHPLAGASGAILASAALGISLAACSSGSLSPSVTPQARTAGFTNSLDPTGLAPQARRYAADAKVPAIPAPRATLPSGVTELAVGNDGVPDILVFNKNFKQIKTISEGLTCADGDWLDRHQNLYDANCNPSAPAILEYRKGATSPTFTYSAGLIDPIGVTVATDGHVYAADYNYGGDGFVVR
ncbi:MAG: hypothetical protein JO104_02830, partial [Candidatus Eremiobacteraeota bacterium]|nr:hypothetical protein [Candidatus Eremiobacteraeota bacterium]